MGSLFCAQLLRTVKSVFVTVFVVQINYKLLKRCGDN